MIPKIIHYCWFGEKPLPHLAKKCIASWRKFFPEYEIIEWNETNFPLKNYVFAQQALYSKKFAFVSDVCRLYALKEIGGIYMDTDVEALKSLDMFLDLEAFSGFENDNFVPTGMMASEKNGLWVNDLIEYYKDKPFINKDGTFETTSNTAIITKMMIDKGFVMNNTYQQIKGYVTFYPNDFFCPKSYKTGSIDLTKNTYCIHHFAKSWIPFKYRLRNIIKMKIMNIFGANTIQKIIDIVTAK